MKKGRLIITKTYEADYEYLQKCVDDGRTPAEWYTVKTKVEVKIVGDSDDALDLLETNSK